MRAYLHVRDGDGKRLGHVRLTRLVTEEAPGLSSNRYSIRTYTHLGFPVLLVEERYADTFRVTYQKARTAVEACGYRIVPELTAAARKVLRDTPVQRGATAR